MKAKLFLILSVCCFLVFFGLLAGLAISKGVQAQSNAHPLSFPHPNPVNSKFPEVFTLQHGLQIQSFADSVGVSGKVFYTVPANKRFIVTDVAYARGADLIFRSNISLYDQDDNLKGMFLIGNTASGMVSAVHFNSGIHFNPEDQIRVTSSRNIGFVTISGYHVDL